VHPEMTEPHLTATATSVSEPAGAADQQSELAHKCLYFMSLMRESEDRIERKLYRQGKIVGGVYVGRGQEAISVGTALHSVAEDVLLPCHRDMAVFFIRGVPLGRIFAQYMGRVDAMATCTWATCSIGLWRLSARWQRRFRWLRGRQWRSNTRV